jgi:hypothetical protein
VLLYGVEIGEGTNSNLRLELKHYLRNADPLQVLYE